MHNENAQLLTIFTESIIETRLVDDIETHGAMGYTISNAKGKGSKGARAGSWRANSNIRVEIICDPDFADKFTQHLKETYYDNYAMVAFISDIEVLRPQKFMAK